MALDKERIQNALVSLALTGSFHPVTYAADNLASVDTGRVIAPVTAAANETRLVFGTAELHRRTDMRDVVDWEFQLRLEWNVEVTLEPFWQMVCDNPPILPRDPLVANSRQVTLEFRAVSPTHPVRQDSTRGTRAVFTVNAKLSPK